MTDYIAYIVGGDSWTPCYVSIYSLLSNNPNRRFKIFILSEENKSVKFFNNIDFLNDVHGDFEVEYIWIDETQYDDFPRADNGQNHLTNGVYFKLSIDDFLPIDGNVLYLDADTIVDGPLDDLLDRDMSDCIIAASPDRLNRILGLDIPNTKRYFNAGVCYINLNNWSDMNIGEKAIKYIFEKNPDLNDQTAMNVTLHQLDMVDIISPEYNAHGHWAKEFQKYDENPIIIHYTGRNKPWHYWTKRPYKKTWVSYCSETPLDNYYPQDKDLKSYLQSKQHLIERTVSNLLEPYPVAKRSISNAYDALVKQ
ncbi:glycosyltransferase family 8 protein [Halorarum salinum]|uniref:Glycosyltransferase family 8 protein n=1 Tax=Halorarum salinum TaxID=2743089 RepID=A0A7D5L9A5_9EURY|nr:glycosyltransferase family 8 protein [Halobaculum salinum]QLG61088.1 glycosyltransferase family 8 protein [Halobaculum salinum]